MKELLNNALLGWGDYNYNGKFAVLLLLILFFFYLRREKAGEKLLLLYTVVMVAACAFPVTAALLLGYQTRFYNYQWIMNYVPITAVIAFGITIFLPDIWKQIAEKEKQTGRGRLKIAGVTMLVVFFVVFCGKMGQPVFDAQSERQERETARAVLAEVAETADGEVILWAPKSIMAYAKVWEPEMYLIYGRNMWDASLDAYTYDTYGQLENDLYRWMSYAEFFGTLDCTTSEGVLLEGIPHVEAALEAGVNRLLLPGNMQPEAVAVLEKYLGVTAKKLDEYYFFVL